ncbi:MAG: hypothetical protein NTY74_05610 [Ignavibacteriae bacterium]|nr:hypothetical protein [Ignavibacteriota bacterium]
MYYKISLPKNGKIIKDNLLKHFELIEINHKTARGETRNISLHCKYDFTPVDLDKFYNEEIDIYLKIDEETDKVKKFINDYGFKKVDKLPKEANIICGNENPVCMRLNWNKR